MNANQFHLIADKILRKPSQRKAAFDVIFNGVTPYRAERDHKCTPGSVSRSVGIIKRHFDHCIAVASAK